MDTTLSILTLSSLSALAIARYAVMPQWFYRSWLGKHKPFSCVTCLSFWTGFVLTLATSDFTLDADLSIYILTFCVACGFASAGLTVVILELTER